MNQAGIALCVRYGYPPNSLSLCGPEKQSSLSYYAATQAIDRGTVEILTQFSTLYPYLKLIAESNNIQDPFDPRIVTAYWIGNQFLDSISERSFERHLLDVLELKRKIPKKKLSPILSKLDHKLLPHHAFHVLNIYHRTGNIDEDHTLPTMDACIIHSGKIVKKLQNSVIVETEPLIYEHSAFSLGPTILREITAVSEDDKIFTSTKIGDSISYHWGTLCTILSEQEEKQLHWYTNLAIILANNGEPE